jgi:hypothetical protein
MKSLSPPGRVRTKRLEQKLTATPVSKASGLSLGPMLVRGPAGPPYSGQDDAVGFSGWLLVGWNTITRWNLTHP